MKILALDLGDKWVGTAIAHPLGITCRPYQTVVLKELKDFLTKILSLESIGTVVVGYPKTVSTGGESEQTRRVVKLKEELEKQFDVIAGSKIEWVLWDERLSSKRASEVQQHKHDAESKKKSHSVAAAFILQSYLDHLAFKRS